MGLEHLRLAEVQVRHHQITAAGPPERLVREEDKFLITPVPGVT